MRYNNANSIKVYGITNEEAELAQKAYDNRNTDDGEWALIALAHSIYARGGNDAILYDISADFNWNYEPSAEAKAAWDAIYAAQ